MKDVDQLELVRAIETVNAGGALLQPSISARLIERLDEDEPTLLTPRSLEVLHLLASGATNKQIAAKLSVTTHTVKFHTERIYRDLGVRSRAEAVRVAMERGLLAV